ncbi:hypothetical protein [Xanthomarina sp. F2636L]|uniref:hypothetical protein n=1 Tax=Xanthomarina sp. F2636L TaxID=2996018 RepID=UPI00225E5681|nr:hypothetical protein [Xanthomarina sp. F2636L]MCX7550572.1 hypothetical protein [Xanthomarina sp. F2636L]
MKTLNFKMFMLIVVAYFNTSYSQDVVYSAIFKNVNKTAESLNHFINTSGDTLYLKSQFDLNKIEVIGTSGLKEYAINDITKEIRIPLSDLPVGDYTFAVVHTEGRDDTYIYRKTIVFKISRLLPIDSNLMKGINPLRSNNDLAIGNIPILDLSENKIIKDFPKPIGLASNDEVQSISLDSKSMTAISDAENSESLASIENKEVLDAKHLRTRKIDNILERTKPAYYKAYNLTDIRSGNHNIQSRADYRRNNLRPNGKPYD